jgi:hypothetical protein
LQLQRRLDRATDARQKSAVTLIALPLMLALAFQPDTASGAQAPSPTAPATAAAASPATPAAIEQSPLPPPAPRPPSLDDKVVAPDGPPKPGDINYRNRVLSNYQATQNRLGPFDGRWTVSGSGGDMFVLQLTDPGEGGKIEGAWRDLRRNGAGRSGLIDSIVRDGDMVTVNFVEAQGGQPVEVRLRSPQPGGWLGEANTPEGGRQSIVMHRATGVETQAAAAPHVAQPPAPRATRSSAARTPTRAKAKKSRHGAAPRRGHVTAKSHSRGSRHSTSRPSSKAKKSTAHKPAAHKSSTKKSSTAKKPTTKKTSSSSKKKHR